MNPLYESVEITNLKIEPLCTAHTPLETEGECDLKELLKNK